MIAILIAIIRINFIKHESIYNGNETGFTLKVDNINRNNNTVIFENKEKLISYCDNFDYDVGDIVYIKGNLSKIKSNTIPNLFNYNKYLQSKGIYYELKISEIKLVKKNNNLFNKIKNSIENRIQKISKSEYLYAFILGNTSYFTKEIRNKYQYNGLTYLLAIGSLQVMVIVRLLEKILLKFKINKKVRLIILFIFLIVYILLTNSIIGVLRSSLSYISCELLKYFKIKYRYINVLIIICIILLLLNPYNLNDIGFLYSFIISFMINRKRKWIKGGFIKRLFMLSLIANIASFPISIYYNYEFNFLSIFLSIIFVPVINYFVFPLAIIVFFFPILSNIFEFLISFIEYINNLFASISFLHFVFRKPSILLIIIYYIYFFKTSNIHYFLICSIIFLTLYANINKILNERIISFLDVNEGDACVLIVRDNAYLIDTGGGFNVDYSESIVKYIHSFGISKIQKMFLSHGDLDHLGSSYNLINKINVKNVYFNSNSYNSNEIKLIKLLEKEKISYSKISNYIFSYDDFIFDIRSFNLKEENDSSMIFSIVDKRNNIKILLTGDMSKYTEDIYLKENNLGNYNILKVCHHGSKTCSSKKFIDVINPIYSIISVGKNNRYGHPNKEVLDNLNNSKIYRTDQDGSIMFKIKNNKLTIETCEP